MPKPNTLQRFRLSLSALTVARNRGHTMSRVTWIEQLQSRSFLQRRTHSIGTSRCKTCGMELLLLTHPAPNETTISGEAVALNCKR